MGPRGLMAVKRGRGRPNKELRDIQLVWRVRSLRDHDPKLTVEKACERIAVESGEKFEPLWRAYKNGMRTLPEDPPVPMSKEELRAMAVRHGAPWLVTVAKPPLTRSGLGTAILSWKRKKKPW